MASGELWGRHSIPDSASRGFAVRGHEKGEPVYSFGRYVLLFDLGHMPELQPVGRLAQPRSGIDFDEGVPCDEPIERGHLSVHGTDRVLGRLKTKVLPQVALAMRLDLVLHQADALDLERLEFLGQHPVVAGPHVDRGGRGIRGAKNLFSMQRHARKDQEKRTGNKRQSATAHRQEDVTSRFSTWQTAPVHPTVLRGATGRDARAES